MKKVGVSGSLALRLHRYDYSLERAYFITSCVARRDKCLGKIKNGFMCVNQYGAVVWEQWFWLAEKYPYVELGSFVVMPDHFHGILIINRNSHLIEKDIKEDDIVAGGRDPRIPLSLEDCSSLNGQKSEGLDPQPQGQGQPQPQGRFLQKIENDVLLIKTKPITELIGAFKSRSSQNIHKLGFKDFVWQTSFYDRIIRNNVEYDSIQKYIIDNPKNWKK